MTKIKPALTIFYRLSMGFGAFIAWYDAIKFLGASFGVWGPPRALPYHAMFFVFSIVAARWSKIALFGDDAA